MENDGTFREHYQGRFARTPATVEKTAEFGHQGRLQRRQCRNQRSPKGIK
ncbi:hypothetical protein QO034_13695 [Sedimentitalea sp. JM2-8]|uniref:Uncharacterized protein n=1 Tax=Sedimentitalea xiamensis TaxID=3050037 RepID=A0ABT7FGD4_9RHOB|nr:hypothetical protein [Sedimentitalea xiamensis]MDK3074168.1 hypothetical protein [Sedimentitalea xiamensis]